MSKSDVDIMAERHSAVPDSSDTCPGDRDAPRRTGSSELVSQAATPPSSDSPTRNLHDLTGTRLGEFRLLRRLGQGGMAEVYLAEQVSLGRNVAVKVLRHDLVADDVHLKRFEQEAKAAGGLNHPNIVQVFLIGQQDGAHYIAQEYVQGMNLREYLLRHGSPELPVALKFMRQIASALEAAAEAGIVHRDIKPENILITNRGDVKVTDFGLAQLSLAGERLHLTQVGMTMGTPLYMSPEQVNGQVLDQRSDIYSFGVTCYHMLCGDPPFRGETALSVAVQHVNREPPPLVQKRPDLPKVVCQVIHKMMAKNPDERYADAGSALADLRRIVLTLRERPEDIEKIRIAFGPPGRPATWLGRILVTAARHQVAAFAASALAVGGIAAAVGWSYRPGSPLEAPITAESKVEPQEDARAQYFRAVFLVDDEEAWRAVIEYFPKDTFYTPRAQAQLASLYLRTNRYDEAKELYDDLVLHGRDDRTKAAAYAGLTVIASLKGQYRESQRIFAQDFIPILRSLRDPDMMRLVWAAADRNSKYLGDKIREEYETLKDRFGEEVPENGSSEPE